MKLVKYLNWLKYYIPAKLERWIGGIYNWQQMAWEWGVTGEKVVFQNFGLPQSNHSKQQYAWHCITIDPTLRYKWSPRSCVERKHYVCEVPAGRIGNILLSWRLFLAQILLKSSFVKTFVLKLTKFTHTRIIWLLNLLAIKWTSIIRYFV